MVQEPVAVLMETQMALKIKNKITIREELRNNKIRLLKCRNASRFSQIFSFNSKRMNSHMAKFYRKITKKIVQTIMKKIKDWNPNRKIGEKNHRNEVRIANMMYTVEKRTIASL